MRYTFRIALAASFVAVVAVAGAAVGQVGSTSAKPEKAGVHEGRRDKFDARHKWRKNRAGKHAERFGRLVHAEQKVVEGDGFVTRIIDHGTVTAVDAAAKTVTLKRKDGEVVTVTADDDTKIVKDRRKATLSAVDVGDMVRTVQVRGDDGVVLKAILARAPTSGTT